MSGDDIRVTIGPFVAGEKPSPLVYTFLDDTGTAIDLSGFTAKLNLRERWGSAVQYNATVSQPALGQVTYSWTGAELPTAGRYTAEIWAGNGTLRYDSILIEFTVRAPVGPVPSI